MKMLQINRIRFTTIPATRIIKEAVIPLDSEERVNEAGIVDKRTAGYKRRQLSMEKGTAAMLELLKAAKTAAIPAKYVLFDSWFSSPSTLHAVKEIGCDVIGMVKK